LGPYPSSPIFGFLENGGGAEGGGGYNAFNAFNRSRTCGASKKTSSSYASHLIKYRLEEKMSKKDKKAKKKHSTNGSRKQDKVEDGFVSASQKTLSSLAPGQQVSIDKKAYEKELARLQVELNKLQ
jgi:hypothetical protein